MPKLNERGNAFRLAIAAFIDARREAKSKSKDDAADAASKYDYTTWLADAARRVGQIQAVTHALKATHPDARGSSMHVDPRTLPPRVEIGTHVLGGKYAEDVVGNAAALDVFKFLKIEVEGRRLLDWMRERDADLGVALHADSATADSWMEAFGGLVRADPAPSSHEAAKQVYWLAGVDACDDSAYHLLQPLHSSSLAHVIHGEIQDARFGEVNKVARQAFRARQAHDGAYRDYRNLIARKLGGTKPQNISQLNSERAGLNYLLGSLPPQSWSRDRPKRLLGVESAMKQFGQFTGVRELVKALARHLLSETGRTMEARDRREAIERALGETLPVFAATVAEHLEAGWSRESGCRLPQCEQCWLDPERSEMTPRDGHAQADAEFKAAYERGDWCDEVADRFANWLNAELREAGVTTVGDVEYRHWARQAVVEAAWPVPLQRRATMGPRP